MIRHSAKQCSRLPYGFITLMFIAGGLQVWCSTASAQSIAQIDAVVIDEMAKQNIVGMAVGIVKDGVVYHAKGYGHADLARRKPITASTMFRWASISKTLTAVSALKLDEQDADFNLGDKVTKHVGYWPSDGNKRNIRIRHLLSNRSGIIHYKNKDDCPDNRSPGFIRSNHTSSAYNAEQGVAVFADEGLCFAPGSAYKYSTFGFSLLGSAIEGGAGKSYSSWVDEVIKTPLAMTSLRQATGTRKGFDQTCQTLKEVSVTNAAWKLPGGGWESNIRDLAKFANGILQESLLNNTSRLWTTVTGNNTYGYGINHAVSKTRVWHGGAHDNTRTLLYLYPQSSSRLGIVLMINGRHADPMRISHHLADLFGQGHNDSRDPVVANCDSNCSGKYSAVWRKSNQDVLLRRGYNHDDFYAEWKFLRKAGYYTDDFEPYVSRGKVYWDAVFRKGSGDNAMWRNFDYDGFKTRWTEQSSKGYRLVDLETYVVGGKRRWAGLFRPGGGKYAMYRGQTTSQFGGLRKQLANDGYRLIDIEAYTINGALKWAGVWRAGKDGPLNRGYSTKDFGNLRTERLKAGYKLVDIETYTSAGKQRWAGVWEKSSSGEHLNRGYNFCGTQDDSGGWTKKGITNRHNQWRQQGYVIADWERH